MVLAVLLLPGCLADFSLLPCCLAASCLPAPPVGIWPASNVQLIIGHLAINLWVGAFSVPTQLLPLLQGGAHHAGCAEHL
jgi:hypothetical protein